LHSRSAALPDKRRGQNVQYDMADIVMSAFAVFFTQSPSFLAHQQALERRQRSSNCQMLFAIKKIPSDNHIRDMLDPVPPQKLFSLFRTALDCLAPSDGEGAQAAHTVAKPDALASFRRLNGHILIALDGTEYFTSQKLGCPTCSTRQRNNGQKEQYHTMLCAALVAPRHNRALPLEPEFIEPQDGHDKQDCETAAVKRWLAAHGDHYARLRPVYLGDDLFSRQPICAAVQAAGGNFIFTAKPTSHKTISEWIDGAELMHLEKRVKKGRSFATHRYRWIDDVPLRDGAMPCTSTGSRLTSSTPPARSPIAAASSPTCPSTKTLSPNLPIVPERVGKSRTKTSTLSKPKVTIWSTTSATDKNIWRPYW